MGSGWIIIVTIVLYLSAMVLIGVYYGKKGGAGSSDDFYLGGRKMGPIVTAMSAEASDMSSYLLMGLPGLAYLCGLPEVSWTCIGLAVGTYLNWLIVARRLRRYSARLGAITVPDFFSRRFGDEKNRLSCIAAAVILIFFVPYTASGFKAIGTLFNSLFGVDYHTAMIVGAFVVIGYTVMGGFMAVSFTDLIQSIFMTIALIAVVLFGIHQAGGLTTVIDNAKALPGYLSLTRGYDVATGAEASFSGLSIISTVAWGLGYFGMPHILLRFMAIEEEKKLNDSRRIASIWVVISMFIAVFIGIIGYSVSAAGKIPFLTTSADAETVIIQLSSLMSQHGAIPAADRRLQRVSGPDAGLHGHEAQRQGRHAGGPADGGRHRRCGHVPGLGSQQLRVPGGVLRLGRLRRGLRPGGAVCPVLEAGQQVGRSGRYAHRRRRGVHLEVPDRPHGRGLVHL